MIPTYRYIDSSTGAWLGAWLVATPTRVRLGGTGGAIDGRYTLDDLWPDPGGPRCTLRDMLASLIDDDDLRVTICGEGDRCAYCGHYRDCRSYYRYTNPQSGVWCRECRDQWACASAFWPASHGSILILSDGWADDDA